MRKRMRVLLAMVLALLFAASAAFAADSFMVLKDPKGGSYLADSGGMALYSLKNDLPGMSICSGACATNWPHFYAPKPVIPKGLDPKDFDSMFRDDNSPQTTFRRMPLYHYSGDKNKGDLNGKAFPKNWSTVDPATFRKK